MAEYSAFPEIHHVLERMPFPGPSWHQVITEHPSMNHLTWSIVFTVACGFVQILCYIITKTFAPILMGYSTTITPPKTTKNHQQHYQRLIELTQKLTEKQMKQYTMTTISGRCCNGELSDEEVRNFLVSVNQHRAVVEQNETRFSESLFPIFTKGFTLGFGILAFYDKDWIYDRALLWKGWPYEQGLDCCAADIKLLHVVHIGWYIYKLFAHAFIDRRLKDATANIIHHCTAIWLLCMSYYANVVRIGVLILLLHDPADLTLQSSKFCRLIGQEFLMNVLFLLLVLVWFATRIVIFPYHAIGACYWEFYEQHGPGWSDQPFMAWSIAFLSVLYVLHIYWFYLILRILMRVISGQNAKDDRSDDDTK